MSRGTDQSGISLCTVTSLCVLDFNVLDIVEPTVTFTLFIKKTKISNTHTQFGSKYNQPMSPQRCDIGDASRGSLSSYAYILMVLYFLQQRQPPVIPVLQEVSADERPPPLKCVPQEAWRFTVNKMYISVFLDLWWLDCSPEDGRWMECLLLWWPWGSGELNEAQYLYQRSN